MKPSIKAQGSGLEGTTDYAMCKSLPIAVCTIFCLEVFLLGKVNMQNLRTPSTEEAREMQKKSAEKRSQNIKERKLIRQVIEERLGCSDLDEIVDNLIDRAKHDSRDFEVLQAALGQKPVEKVQATQTVVDMSAFSTEEIKAMLDEEV